MAIAQVFNEAWCWRTRAFWLNTEKQNKLLQQIQNKLESLKERLYGARGDAFIDYLDQWQTAFKDQIMPKAKKQFNNNITHERSDAAVFIITPFVEPYATKAVKKIFKGKKSTSTSNKKQSLKSKKKNKSTLGEKIGQGMSGYAGSQVGRLVAEELELEKDSAGDFTCRGVGTFGGRTVHGVMHNGLENTFTKKATGINAAASAGGIGGEWIGEKIGKAIGKDCGNEDTGEVIGGAVGSIAGQVVTQAIVTSVCLVM